MSSQDLIRDTEEHKNYSGGLLAILVICLLLGLIALVTFLTMPDSGPIDNLMPVYFSDIFTISSLVAKFEYEWKDGHLVFCNSTGHFYSIKHSPNIRNASIILSKQHYAKGMSVSFDLTVWLIPVSRRQNEDLVEEYSYKLYYPSRISSHYRPIIIDNDQISYLTTASWGPRSKYMVAVYRNNVYYSLNPLEAASFICITCKINQSKIYGQFLGYYKERIFKNNKPFWWNSNGQFLSFLSFANEEDKKVEVEIFDPELLYQKYQNISYAKAGLSPSLYKVDIHVFNIASQTLYSLNIDSHTPYKPFYIIHLQWYNGSFLLVAILSADQMQVTMLLCQVMKSDCFSVFDKISSHSIRMEEYQSVAIDNDNGYIYIAISVPGDIKFRRHIGRIRIERFKKNMIIWLNLANHYIVRLTSFDPMSRCIHFLASNANHSSHHLYKVNVVTEETSCETCQFTACLRNEVQYSDTQDVFIHRCLGPEPESYRLIKALDRGYQSVELETNEKLRNYITNKSLPRVEYSSIDIFHNRRKYRIMVKILHPRHLNPNHVIQYPALLILPDAPLKFIANDDFQVGWVEYLTSYLQYVVIKLDVGGTNDNEPFLPMPSLSGFRSGHADLLLGAIKDIISRRPFIDNSSIGVIGENYGGYIAGRLMTNDKKFPDFRCGVSVSPIVDFASYGKD